MSKITEKAFIQIPDKLFEGSYQTISVGGKLAYAVMLDGARRAGCEFSGISQVKLAKLMQITRKTAAKYINELIIAGLIIPIYNDGRMIATKVVSITYQRFYRLPMEVLSDDRLSLKEKCLFALLLSRACLSEKNGYITDLKTADPYFVYRLKEIEEMIGVSHSTAVRIVKELAVSGYIDRVLVGGRRPAINTMHKPKAQQMEIDYFQSQPEMQIIDTEWEEQIPEKMPFVSTETVNSMGKNETTKQGTPCVKTVHQKLSNKKDIRAVYQPGEPVPISFCAGMGKNHTLAWVKLRRQRG